MDIIQIPTTQTPGAGLGDVVGPASATDNAVVRYDAVTGRLLQNSSVTIADTTGDIAGASSLTAPTTTDLTLSGGSSGASLVLGQASTDSTALTANVNLYLQKAAASSVVFRNNAAGSYTESMRIAGTTGNLLIGTTTDMSGTAGLKVAGTTASTGVDTGALQVAGGIYAGAASVFAGLTTTGLNQFDGLNAASRALIVGPVAQSGGNLPYASIKTSASFADFALNIENTNSTSGQGLGLRIVSGSTASDLPLFVRDRTNATTLFSVGGTGAATFAGAVAIGNTVAVAVAAASTHKVTMVIGGVTYYLLASNV